MVQKAQGWAKRNEVNVTNNNHSNYSMDIHYYCYYLLTAFHIPSIGLSPVSNIISFNICNSSVSYIFYYQPHFTDEENEG